MKISNNPITKSIPVGNPGTKAKKIRPIPTITRALLSFTSCITDWFANLSSSILDRVMIIAVAVESTRAGICATRPSPIVKIVYISPDSAAVKSWEKIPIKSPPIKLTMVIMIPATASPFTNLLDPSIAP